MPGDWQESEPRAPAMSPCLVLRRLLAQRNELMGLLPGAVRWFKFYIIHFKRWENVRVCPKYSMTTVTVTEL